MSEYEEMLADGLADALRTRGASLVLEDGGESLPVVLDMTRAQMEGADGGYKVVSVLAADFSLSHPAAGKIKAGVVLLYEGSRYEVREVLPTAKSTHASLSAERLGTQKSHFAR